MRVGYVCGWGLRVRGGVVAWRVGRGCGVCAREPTVNCFVRVLGVHIFNYKRSLPLPEERSTLVRGYRYGFTGGHHVRGYRYSTELYNARSSEVKFYGL